MQHPAMSMVEREDNPRAEPGLVGWDAAHPNIPLSDEDHGSTARACLVDWIGDADVAGIEVFSPGITIAAGISVRSEQIDFAVDIIR